MRRLLRGFRVLFLVVVAASLPSAHAAWGDVSDAPNPALIDEDQAAGFDSFGLLTHVVSQSIVRGGGTSDRQDFESGFVSAQVLTDWVRLGDNRVRFGFGDSLQQIDWRSRIGQVDPDATAFGFFHPRGTYGNAAGVSGDPRNYIADHYFLTADSAPGEAKPYLVMQFERPIVFVALSISDYTSDVGGHSRFDLLVGNDLATAVALPEYGHTPERTWPREYLIDGGFLYAIGNGKSDPSPGVANRYPAFNFAVLRLAPPDATVGFDNLMVVNAVPLPDVLALFLAGLGALATARRCPPAGTQARPGAR